MSELTTIAAKKRDRAGKGGARAARRDGLIPAVIYGDKQPPLPISVEPKQLLRVMIREGFLTHRMAIDVEGTKVEVLPRDVQLDPVTDRPVHFDFLRLGAGSIITVDVPVHFRNEAASPGIKRGGILNVIRHAITVRTRADQIPEFFEVDLTGLEIGHSVHLSALNLPEGVRVVSREKNATIASVAPPTVGREAETAAAAAPAAGAAPASGAAAPAAGAAAAAPAKAAAAPTKK
ncbi:50S ribosomal protein L25/general stress protein Ctc [Reyranella sp. CPCC 100927]|uniref:50S ribosomal protein L25/general stress protein Ctc n=1 Tax=Reyranella sp. CPCC 100927 TaxID=2599616 RepID=UPI0011B41A6C|nr:50S ribosomal protein L25/general stress protein Ctc [Reyranella sp. CPCC 100927]TWT03169.1 50S ribosomal protein L25/general stress protein Ctc [Reyranella sp. CPCC 100927]